MHFSFLTTLCFLNIMLANKHMVVFGYETHISQDKYSNLCLYLREFKMLLLNQAGKIQLGKRKQWRVCK